MKKKNTTSIIDAALEQAGFSNPEQNGIDESATNVDNIFDGTIITDDDNTNEDPADDAEDNMKDSVENPDSNDDSEIPENVLNNDNNDSSESDDSDDEQGETEEVDQNESNQVTAFFDAFAEAMHWQVDDKNKPNTVDGIVDYMTQLVEENSKPQYSDPRVKQLDEYIKNGGQFDDFYTGLSQEIQYDMLDMEDESNQKAVVSEYLQLQGYNDDQIKKKIDRYMDADMLEDEAQDAVSQLKIYKQHELEQQQIAQQQAYEQQQQQLYQFSSDLSNSISNLTQIRGINVPREDRAALMDYITRTDENGLTQYQKDFNSNMVNNLIESAYFTMKGDALISGAEKKGNTDAVTKLRKMLRHSSKNRSSQNVGETKRSAIDIASRLFG